MRTLRLFFFSIVVLCAAYVIHVPVLLAFSKLSTSARLQDYPPISEKIQSESYEIAHLLRGTNEIWFDQHTEQYLVFADLTKGRGFEDSGRFIVTIGPDGHFIDKRRVTNADPLPDYDGDPRYRALESTPERKYVPRYSFDTLKGRLELVKYKFTSFSDWPYFYYFVPVIPFDWEGIGFIDVIHHGERLSFQLPTDFYGGLFYSTSNIDGQLYVIEGQNDASRVVFLEVAESSYTYGMDGVETHREGYGLHVIRPRDN